MPNVERRTLNIELINVLFVFVLLVPLAIPCTTYAYNLPSMPSLPSGDMSQPGGIVSPDNPEEESNTARPAGYKETGTGTESGALKENKNKISNRPLGTKIDTRVDKKNPQDKPIKIDGKPLGDKEPSPDEQAAETENRKPPWLLTPFNVQGLRFNVQGSKLNPRKNPIERAPQYRILNTER